ncbi:MAG: hypothetical protein KatS3mg082_2220 [Nitrospiraceae bacterium]|nr:MAG: hypothetical protein KatS3mg082_2220 [Nitrospiraceae bacterium]
MKLDQAFRLSSILLAAAAFCGLTMATGLSVWILALGGIALVVRLFQIGWRRAEEGGSFIDLSPATWNVLLVLAFVGFWIDLLWISQDLLSAGVHFLIALLANKLFNLHQRRDFLHLYAISLMAILASAALTTEVWYATVFFAYLLTAVWTLLLYHLTKETEEAVSITPRRVGVAESFRTGGRITPRFFWTTNAIAMGAFCLTLAIFFTIPRIGAGFFHKGRTEGLKTSGFSDRVDLGVIGSVKQDASIVMRVELADRSRPATERLYLRGVAYDRYNGRSWSNSFTHRRILLETAPGTFRVPGSVGRSPSKGSQKEGLRQDILLEALDTTVLFSVPFADSISGEFLTVQGDVTGALYLPSPPTTRLEYIVVSHDNQLTEEDKSGTTFTYPDFVRAHFLQLPPISPQVTELAAHVTRQADTPYRKVIAIKQHLLEQYRYSLDISSTLTARPLEDFLFTRKTGYCEHYATAMVVLLRAIGVPARLVTGFLATEWNDFGNYYTVRQKDAHAWVEVFFPRSGWITVDPTPTIGESAPDLWWQSISRVMDSVRLRWDRLIVQYSASDQLAVVQGIREGGDSLRIKISQSLTGWLNPLSNAMIRISRLARHADPSQLAVMLTLVVLGGTFFVVLLQQMIRPRRGDGGECPAEQRAVTQVYKRMVDLLATYGLTKAPSAAPIEFAKQVRRERNDAGSLVEALTQFYCRVRFGKSPLTREDLVRADQLLAQLRTVLRSSGNA